MNKIYGSASATIIFFTIGILTLFWGIPSWAVDGNSITNYPQRVVSLSPIITETIYLVGAQDKLVANTTYCNVPAEAMKKEKIGSVTQMNVEKIVRLKPDLVIASALSKEKQLMILEKMGIEVMRAQNPKTFDEMCHMTLSIGRILGHETEAEVVIDRTRHEATHTLSLTEGLQKPRVFMQIGLKPLHSANKEMFINEYIRYTGGINIAENEPSGVYSREKVVAENPDIILVATMGSSKKAGELEKARWMSLKGLKAAKTKRIHVLDPEMICSPTPVTFVKGIAELLPLIHRDIRPHEIAFNEK